MVNWVPWWDSHSASTRTALVSVTCGATCHSHMAEAAAIRSLSVPLNALAEVIAFSRYSAPSRKVWAVPILKMSLACTTVTCSNHLSGSKSSKMAFWFRYTSSWARPRPVSAASRLRML